MQALVSVSSATWKRSATFIDSIRTNINQEITKNPEIRSNFYQIVSYCLGLHTQTPVQREVDWEPSPKRGSDKINIQKQERNTQKNASRIARAGLTYESQHLEKQTWNPVLREEPIGPEP